MIDWKKQMEDQALHLSIGAGIVYLLAEAFQSVWVGVAIVAIGWFIREYKQWPSARWWDPLIDWFFEVAGIGIGVWWYL